MTSSSHLVAPPTNPVAAWTFRLLDRFLWPEILTGDAQQLKRGRVLVGLLLLMAPNTLLLLFATGAWGHPRIAVTGLLALASFVLALALTRWRRSLVVGALTFGATHGGVILFVALHRDAFYTLLTPWQLVLPLIVLYLVGARGGLAMAAVICAEILLVFILRGMGVGFDEAILPAPMQSLTFAAITAIFAAWWIGWLHRSAADEAHAALLGTNQELKRSEANLSSIFESTDDLVCLLDDQARLVAANRAFFAALRWLGKGQPKEGDALLAAIDGKRRSTWKGRFAQVRSGERVRFEERYQREGRELCLDVSISPVRSGEGALTGFALFGRDITARVDAERKLKAMHHQLVDASRSAGMAEVATSVLHNVGNVLNSVNVGVSLLRERLCRSRVTSLTKASELLASRAEDLAHFLSADERGKQLPAFVVAVSKHLESERRDMLAETEQLTTHVAHITEIVARQQQHAQAVSLTETVSLDEMVEDALRLVGSSFEEQGVTIERDYDPGAAPLTLDRHQLLQILANLLANARDALVASRSSDKRMAVRIVLGASSTRIEVVDNGVGVSAEHLDRIFGQGFTTKKHGHGFGLHASALAAAQMGATLTCHSDGPGEGATFTLSLPREGATRAA